MNFSKKQKISRLSRCVAKKRAKKSDFHQKLIDERLAFAGYAEGESGRFLSFSLIFQDIVLKVGKKDQNS